MKIQLRGIGHRFMDMLGFDVMGAAYSMLAVNYIFMMLYATLESVFVNTLLYRVSGGKLSVVIAFRAITYIVSGVCMNIAAYLTQKKTPVIVVRIGSMFFLLMYIVLFAGLNHMDKLQYLVAVLSGLGGCFYWTGHNVLLSHYSTKHNRDLGVSILGMIQGAMTLLVPIVSGFVISKMPGNIGYRIMFGVGMAAVGAQFYCTMRFTPVENNTRTSEIVLAIKLILKEASYKMLMCYEFIRGMRDGTFAFVLNMVLFEIITDESLVGINTFITGMAAITGSWAFGKLVNGSNRARYSMASMAVLTVICASLFVKMNAPMVMLFAALNAFLQLFFLYSCGNTTFDIVSQNEISRKCAPESFAMREVATCLGRVLGLGIMANFPQTQLGHVQAMCLLTMVQYIGAWIMGMAMKELERKREAVQAGG